MESLPMGARNRSRARVRICMHIFPTHEQVLISHRLVVCVIVAAYDSYTQSHSIMRQAIWLAGRRIARVCVCYNLVSHLEDGLNNRPSDTIDQKRVSSSLMVLGPKASERESCHAFGTSHRSGGVFSLQLLKYYIYIHEYVYIYIYIYADDSWLRLHENEMVLRAPLCSVVDVTVAG